jgi:hypothetical protein
MPGDLGEVTARLSGGSCPGGEKLSGVVVGTDGVVTALAVGARDISYGGGGTSSVRVDITVHPSDGSGDERASLSTDPRGHFGYTPAKSGDTHVLVSGGAKSNFTDVDLDLRRYDHTLLVVRLIDPKDAVTDHGRKSRIDLDADFDDLSPGEVGIVSASIPRMTGPCPQLVWVAETSTDAVILPTDSPDEIAVQAGNNKGKIVVWAQLDESRSRKMTIRVSDGRR